ncbi:MAG: hypothetical protein AAFX99_26340 [Myxococcota bacterium]
MNLTYFDDNTHGDDEDGPQPELSWDLQSDAEVWYDRYVRSRRFMSRGFLPKYTSSSPWDALPKRETLKHYGQALIVRRTLHLCEWCLRTRPRCHESYRHPQQRSWKRHRRTQYHNPN